MYVIKIIKYILLYEKCTKFNLETLGKNKYNVSADVSVASMLSQRHITHMGLGGLEEDKNKQTP